MAATEWQRCARAVLVGTIAMIAAYQPGYAAESKSDAKSAAIVIEGTSDSAQRLSARALARFEEIIADNGYRIADRENTVRLRKIWLQLDDPGYVATADDFVKNAAPLALDVVFIIYVSSEVAQPLRGVFSATAQADIRVAADDGTISSFVTPVFGAPGRPPSDGLTEDAALLNALERAVDEAASKVHLKVRAPVAPRAVPLELRPAPAGSAVATAATDSDNRRRPDSIPAGVETKSVALSERITCSEIAPGGDLAIFGTSITQWNRLSNRRTYGSRLVIVDTAANRIVNEFYTNPVGPKPIDFDGPSGLLDCRFVQSWRFVVGITGNVISLWDTERGSAVSEIRLASSIDEAELDLVKTNSELLVIVRSSQGSSSYEIAVRK